MRPRLPLVHSRSEAGLTLVEVLVTLLLLSLVVGGLLPLLTAGPLVYGDVTRRQEMTQNARVVLDKLIRELRAAESFRILAPGAVRLTLNWGDSSDATPTVEYALNPVTREVEYRWLADYDYRRRITVLAVDAVPAGYAVPITFNHQVMVLAGKSLAGGDDVRVRYWNGTAMVEVDRVLDPTSAWDGATTTIWFPLQAPLPPAGTSADYYLYYGDAAAGGPPANGDNVFLDYEDGTTIDGWTRRDARSGVYTTSPANGVIFTAAATNGYRELTKNVPHSDVEIFWRLWSGPGDAANGRQVGIGARLSDTGAGYRVTPGERVGATNNRIRLRYWTGWGQGGGLLATGIAPNLLPDTLYNARLYLVGSSFRAKLWTIPAIEPPWQVTRAAPVASGSHYGFVDGLNVPMDHRHQTIIVRPRVALEPLVTVGLETAGTRPDTLDPLGGSFRSLTLACFDSAGAVVGCAPAAPVRSVEVSLVAMDPAGVVADIVVTGRAFRQKP